MCVSACGAGAVTLSCFVAVTLTSLPVRPWLCKNRMPRLEFAVKLDALNSHHLRRRVPNSECGPKLRKHHSSLDLGDPDMHTKHTRTHRKQVRRKHGARRPERGSKPKTKDTLNRHTYTQEKQPKQQPGGVSAGELLLQPTHVEGCSRQIQNACNRLADCSQGQTHSHTHRHRNHRPTRTITDKPTHTPPPHTHTQ